MESSKQMRGVFNLPAAVNDLLGAEGWDRALKIIHPRIWALRWSDDQLRAQFTAAHERRGLSFEQTARLRIAELPGTEQTRERTRRTRYAIRHYTGTYGGKVQPSEFDPLFDLLHMSLFARMLERLGVPNDTLLSIYRQRVSEALAVDETRLVIIQTRRCHQKSENCL
jgi:hypothetical protein